MLTEYIVGAMQQAKYEMLPEEEGYYGEIPALPGVWANAPTLDVCREELREVLESWILVGVKLGHPLPIIAGINRFNGEE